MIQGANVRRLYESFVNNGSDHDGQTGRRGFVNLLESLTGLDYDQQGRRRVNLDSREMRPEEFDFRELGEAMVGPDFKDHLSGNSDDALLLEDATSAQMPGAAMNISAWNTSVAGLLEAKVLESYQRPEFIGERLAKVMPTRLRSNKLIGYSEIGDISENMNPGQRHPRAQVGEEFVTTPLTKKRGLAIDVTREAIFFDETRGQLMERAEAVGEWLGWNKERLIIDTVIGVSNTYTYGGTTFDTYQAASPWINDHSNELVDWHDVDDSEQLFVNMSDPALGEPIAITANQVLVMPAKKYTAGHIFNATQVETRTNSAADVTIGGNPLGPFPFDLLPPSPIVYRRHIDADGLNLSAANAQKYWYHGDFQKAFLYMENWAMGIKRASPDSYTMADQDLIMSIFANEMGIPAVKNPRYVVRNKN